jgi:hypothetical protein
MVFNVTGHSGADMGWTNRDYLVTATNNVTRIRLVSFAVSAYGPELDNVSLTPVPPTPVSYSVVVANGGGSVTSIVARIEFDADNDGLADSWERSYFGRSDRSLMETPTAMAW